MRKHWDIFAFSIVYRRWDGTFGWMPFPWKTWLRTHKNYENKSNVHAGWILLGEEEEVKLQWKSGKKLMNMSVLGKEWHLPLDQIGFQDSGNWYLSNVKAWPIQSPVINVYNSPPQCLILTPVDYNRKWKEYKSMLHVLKSFFRVYNVYKCIAMSLWRHNTHRWFPMLLVKSKIRTLVSRVLKTYGDDNLGNPLWWKCIIFFHCDCDTCVSLKFETLS